MRPPLALGKIEVSGVWADPASLRWLIYLSRRMDRQAVAVLAARGWGERAESKGLLAQLLSGAIRMPLAGLPADSVARLIAERLQVPPADEFVQACVAATGGNPLLLGEVVEALAERGVAPTAAAARDLPSYGSRRLGEAIVLRLGQSGADLIRLATAAATLGEFGLEAAGAAAGLSLPVTVAAAAALDRLDVLAIGERVTFGHEIVRRSLLAALPDADRSRLHVRAARALLDRCAPAPAVAAHLVLAATPVGEEWAALALRSAARTALAGGVPERARVLLRRLLAEPLDRPARASCLAELGGVEAYVDLPAAIEHLRAALPILEAPGEL